MDCEYHYRLTRRAEKELDDILDYIGNTLDNAKAAAKLMEAIGRKRGLLVRGGEVNTERCAVMLVDEFRACKWGRISLERPPQRDDMADFAEEDEE